MKENKYRRLFIQKEFPEEIDDGDFWGRLCHGSIELFVNNKGYNCFTNYDFDDSDYLVKHLKSEGFLK